MNFDFDDASSFAHSTRNNLSFHFVLFQAIKQFIDLVNQLSSCSSIRRNASQSTALKFLYARKFDVPRAVSLYEQHEQTRQREQLYSIDPSREPLKSELLTGKFTILVSIFPLSLFF